MFHYDKKIIRGVELIRWDFTPHELGEMGRLLGLVDVAQLVPTWFCLNSSLLAPRATPW